MARKKDVLVKLAILAVLATATVAVAAFAFAAKGGKEYGEQPGYTKASDCGQAHGSFSYFDGDTNLGTNSLGPGTPTYHNGAVGQEPGATGYNNSNTGCNGQ